MYREMGPATTMTDSAIEACLCPTLVCVPVCATPARDGPLAAGAREGAPEACPSLSPGYPPSLPGGSFAFSSLSFPRVGLVSGPDPVQYLSPGSAICSHFHMFNIHISCLLPCPIVVMVLSASVWIPETPGTPVFAASPFSQQENVGGCSPELSGLCTCPCPQLYPTGPGSCVCSARSLCCPPQPTPTMLLIPSRCPSSLLTP